MSPEGCPAGDGERHAKDTVGVRRGCRHSSRRTVPSNGNGSARCEARSLDGHAAPDYPSVRDKRYRSWDQERGLNDDVTSGRYLDVAQAICTSWDGYASRDVAARVRGDEARREAPIAGRVAHRAEADRVGRRGARVEAAPDGGDRSPDASAVRTDRE